MVKLLAMVIADIKTNARRLIWNTAPGLYRRAVGHRPGGQVFSIGMRRGVNPLAMAPVCGDDRPVITVDDITDVPASFVADPFMLRYNDEWVMYFEVLNNINRLGQIGYATSRDGMNWTYQGTALAEPFHLAYPLVFEWDDGHYMVPDSPDKGVLIYRAQEFPAKWERVAELMPSANGYFSDSSIFKCKDYWWMFTAWSAEREEPRCLRLFYADKPLGEWREHPQSPVKPSASMRCRPAGRPIWINGALHRMAQDCSTVYGEKVYAYRINKLTPTCYSESRAGTDAILSPSSQWWNNGGMHHIDAHQLDENTWLACVDGWYRQPQ